MCESSGVGLFGADEGQGHVDAVDLADPLFFLGSLAAEDQVLLDFNDQGQEASLVALTARSNRSKA
ncbi:hypothetical protein [Streptomyces luteogriseus]|uniref:hypothetical protein n=1 Tax=Streptomyces luteogriseus TaxID=68233 RepID=UPI0037A18F63